MPVDRAATYRVVINTVLSDGGDGFATFRAGSATYVGGLDIDAFAAYLPTVSPYSPGPLNRIAQ